MATTQKTTLKRYNGTDWDPVYLANSADIVYLGKGFTVDKTGAAYANGDAINANTNVADILAKVINSVANIGEVQIPGLKSGADVEHLAASKLTGKVLRANLDDDISGKGIEVADEEAKAELTKNDVNVGDIVKVTGGKVYLVSAVSDVAVTYMELTDSASDIAWARVTGKPTTLSGYGITDAVNADEKVTEAKVENAGKILVLNAAGKLDVDVTGDAATLEGHAASYFATKTEFDTLNTAVTGAGGIAERLGQAETDVKNINAAWITTGTIDIDRIPHAALERCVPVTQIADLAEPNHGYDLQNGDTVRDTATNLMYFVTDATKLGTADYMLGLTVYSAGTAAAVAWANVTGKPTVVADSGLTDAVATGDMSETVVTGKGVKFVNVEVEDVGTYNVAGVAQSALSALSANKAADADKLGGNQPSYYAVAADLTNLTNLVGSVESGKETGLSARIVALETYKDNMDSTVIPNINNGTSITALSATKLTDTVSRSNLPAAIGGTVILKADMDEATTSLTTANAFIGDMVKMADGSVYVITGDPVDESGYTKIIDVGGATIDWSQLTNIPTSLAAMNWSDAVTTAMLVDEANTTNKGKILKIADDGKLHASITGDAATLEGHAASYFAVADDFNTLNEAVTGTGGITERLTQAETDVKNINASWITGGTIDIDRLPHGALERCVTIEALADLADPTKVAGYDLQNGDTAHVNGGDMYFITDATKLGTADYADGIQIYSAGRATSVDWSGVENKPTTLAAVGWADAVTTADLVTTAGAANKGKILVLNNDGKLDVDITGAADFTKLINAPTSTAAQIDDAVEAATHTNRAVLDLFTAGAGANAGRVLYDNNVVAWKSEVDSVSLGALKVVDELPAGAATGQLVLEAVSAD